MIQPVSSPQPVVSPTPKRPGAGESQELSAKQQTRVEELKATDREVRAHERAHAAAAGELARGGPSYDYATGPDGKRYAVGGEVQIDTTEVRGDPQATLEKAERIIRAALAPSQPSGQDRQVAAKARAMAAEAQRELARERYAEQGEGGPAERPDSGLSFDVTIG